MARHRTHSIAFKRQVVEDYLSGEESLHGLAKHHDICRNLIRIWVGKHEAGAFDEEVEAAALLQEYEARIAALEREVGQFGRGGDRELNPVFWENQNGDVIAGDWAEGFMDAVKLRPGDWVALFEDEEMRPGISPILALVSDEEGESLLDVDREELKGVRLEAASEIPRVVLEIDRFWKARRAHGHLCMQPAHFNDLITSEIEPARPPLRTLNPDCRQMSARIVARCRSGRN